MDEIEQSPEFSFFMQRMLQNVTLEALYQTETFKYHVSTAVDKDKTDKAKADPESLPDQLEGKIEHFRRKVDKYWSEDSVTQIKLINRWWCEVAISREVDAFQYYVSQILL